MFWSDGDSLLVNTSERSISNAIVMIDEMGCQKAIIEQIDKARGDYVIAVRYNQLKLALKISEDFRQAIQTDLEEIDYHHSEVCDSGHGQSNIRSYYSVKISANFILRKE